MSRATSKTNRSTEARICCLVTTALLLSLTHAPAEAFRIVSPADGATLTSDRPVPVEIEAGQEAGLVEVRYYWYPEQTESLV